MKKENDLSEAYRAACNGYLKSFCYKHGWDYRSDVWVGDMPGTWAWLKGDAYDMQTIMADIDNEVPEAELGQWMDYCNSIDQLNEEIDESWAKIPHPNFESWCNGCPRLSNREITTIFNGTYLDLTDRGIYE